MLLFKMSCNSKYIHKVKTTGVIFLVKKYLEPEKKQQFNRYWILLHACKVSDYIEREHQQ
jgi:hypothetical protein